ncbi:MAG TPA: methyltransferase domain-containing protein [Polyangiaceae bacterium]|nr:methyltransferase domain-containing protein [Polyangiaceae bacterium]
MTNPLSPMSTPEPWQLVAQGYAAEASLVMAPFSVRAIELLAPGPSARVIDVAAGPGTLSTRLAPAVREIVALDFSERMVAELEAAARAAGLVNLRSVIGDGQNLPFADDEFDAGFSIFGLMFFPDRVRGFGELRRVLKPGAGAVVSSWAPVQDSPLLRAMFGALAAADPTFVMPVRNDAGVENPEVLAAEMRAGGFERVRIEPMTLSIRPADADDLWQRMARSSAPLVLLRNRIGEAEWRRREPIIRKFLSDVLAREPELSTTAWLAVGYKP